MRPERGDALPCPAIAVAGHQAVPVEDAGNQIDARQELQDLNGSDRIHGREPGYRTIAI